MYKRRERGEREREIDRGKKWLKENFVSFCIFIEAFIEVVKASGCPVDMYLHSIHRSQLP